MLRSTQENKMKRLVKTESGYKMEEGSFLGWTADCIVKPVTLEPTTGAQTLVFGAVTCVAGVAIGATIGKKAGQKIASAFVGEKKIKEYA